MLDLTVVINGGRKGQRGEGEEFNTVDNGFNEDESPDSIHCSNPSFVSYVEKKSQSLLDLHRFEQSSLDINPDGICHCSIASIVLYAVEKKIQGLLDLWRF
ncbi:hypothetical protein GWI33_016610 [Rhynchophorus ferrugineus]|uniref:Uncharacterized protein n=1 Tax=Rhynchophorus ferrugineus TaxID=354439 RepID=A0A834I382_RHYFE|nr:hypothetical protein GWI33_016610 [Rhynchophorus ferrugineus]